MDDSRLYFLGKRGLAALHHCSVTVVGCGGGGSHIVQQLAHLGVERISLIDPDELDASNLNRVVGTSVADVGKSKAEILAKRYAWTASRLVPIARRVQSPEGIAAVQSSDIAFGAVDRFRARDDVERICRQAIVPYVDIGLGIRVQQGHVISAAGQVVLSSPGRPCLRCVDVINEERLAQDKEEYVHEAAPDQQVISMNGLLASEAVNIFLAITTGYAASFEIPRYVVYNALLHELAPHPFYGFARKQCPHYPLEHAGNQLAGARC